MAAPGPVVMTQAFRQYIGDATDVLGQATYKCRLLTSAWTPVPSTNAVWADISANEVSNANGYTTGGVTMTGTSFTQTGGVGKFAGVVPAWTASGVGITARYAVMCASGTFNGHVDPIVGYFLLDSTPADVVTASGNQLQLNQPGGGWLTVT